MAASRAAATSKAVVAAKSRTAAIRPKPWSDALATRLAAIGLTDRVACALHLPLRYEDETRLSTLADARDGDTVQFEAVVRDHAIQYRPRRQLLVHVDDVHAVDARHAGVALRFLHFYGSQVKHFAPGTRLRIRGDVRGNGFALFGGAGREMIHPRYGVIDDATPLPDRLTPVYPSSVGLGQPTLRRVIADALDADVRFDETVPAALLARHRLPAIDASIRLIHHPPPDVPQELLMSRTPSGVAAGQVRRAARPAVVARSARTRRVARAPHRSSRPAAGWCGASSSGCRSR